MKIFNTEDNQVTKIIHKDGSETAIKSVPSCEYNENLDKVYNDRGKYTVFISSSVGCSMNCTFCHLTIKKCPYKKLSEEEVLNNLKEAIEYKLKQDPELSESYIKLSWMGMGDALLESKMVLENSMTIMRWVMENNYAKGLDGIDLSTVYPRTKSVEWVKNFNELNTSLSEFPRNPNHSEERSNFRFFYSMHSIYDQMDMMPNTTRSSEVLKILRENETNFNIILHRIFIEGENDGIKEVKALKEVLSSLDYELRILRYNFCEKSPFRESPHIKEIVKELLEVHDKIKVQVSPGSEVKAACGQFIVDVES